MLSIRCGGTASHDQETPEKIITHPNLLSLKIDILGGVNIIGPCEGEPLEEFDLSGVHFALYEDKMWSEFLKLLDGYEGSLLFEATINGIEIRYTK